MTNNPLNYTFTAWAHVTCLFLFHRFDAAPEHLALAVLPSAKRVAEKDSSSQPHRSRYFHSPEQFQERKAIRVTTFLRKHSE
jgi:hypothetical protein